MVYGTEISSLVAEGPYFLEGPLWGLRCRRASFLSGSAQSTSPDPSNTACSAPSSRMWHRGRWSGPLERRSPLSHGGLAPSPGPPQSDRQFLPDFLVFYFNNSTQHGKRTQGLQCHSQDTRKDLTPGRGRQGEHE